MTRKIVHLIDDATLGGVTRFLEHLTTAPALANELHRIVPVTRGRWSPPVLEADVVVSHLTVSWTNLPMLLALRARHPATPIVHVEHSYSEQFVARHVSRPSRFRTLLRTAYALFECVVAVSEGQARWMRRLELVADESLSVIRPSVDLTPFLSIPARRGEVHRIAAIGRLDVQKGFDILIQAFRTHAPAGMTLDLHGDGPERERLEAFADCDPRIVFHGTSDPVVAMAEADVIAVPSIREPYGLVALEGRAAGRLVLVSGADGLADHVYGGAVALGSSVKEWGAALQNASILNQPERLTVARRLARESAVRSLQKWADLFDALAPVEEYRLAS